jgi:hypothetical protein
MKLEKLEKLEPIAFFTKYLPTKKNPLPSLKCPQRGGEGKALFTSQDVLRIRKQQAKRHQYRSLLHSSGLPPVQE